MTEGKAESPLEKYLMPIAILLGAVIIAIAFIYGRDAMGTDPASQPAPSEVDIAEVSVEGVPFAGDRNAPVTIAVWADYQCPFCKQLALGALTQVYDTYVKEGKVKIVYKDFQFLGPDSMTAALYGRAVWDAYPARYHDWHIAMMGAQDEEHGGFGDEASVRALTATIEGVDAERVASLVAEKGAEYEAAIAADRAEGTAFGINGTPSLIIGTSLLSGAQPFSAIQPLIEAELQG